MKSVKNRIKSKIKRLCNGAKALTIKALKKLVSITPLGKDSAMRAWRHYHIDCLFTWEMRKTISKQFDKMISEHGIYCNMGRIRRFYYKIDCYLAWVFIGAVPEDYFSQDYFNKSWRWRNKTVTRLRLNFLKGQLNNPEVADEVDNKLKFYRTWDKYLGRKWCLLSETDLEAFERIFRGGVKTLFVKELMGYGGFGVEKITVNSNLKDIYSRLKASGKDLLVEECIEQKGILSLFNPSSVNTIRVSTVRVNNKAYVINSFFRCGCGDSHVDNLHSGGLLFPVDRETGLIFDGLSYTAQAVKIHPITKHKIAGEYIPDWANIKEYCCEAHLLAPKGINWIGWDVVWSNGKLYLIEGNTGPGQRTDLSNKKETIWQDYLNVLRAVMKNEQL